MFRLFHFHERCLRVSDYIMPLISTPTRKRLAKGAFWGGVAVVGARVITVASSFALARILGQQSFGEYGIVNSTAGMIGSMAGLGIGQTVVKFVSELKLSDPERAGRILALSSLVTWLSAAFYGMAFIVLAPWLAEKTLAAPHLSALLQISAITVALGVMNSVQSCSLNGCESFQVGSYVNVASGVIQSGLVVLGAWYWGLQGAIIAMAIGMIVTVLLTHLVVMREWQKFGLLLRWQDVWSEWRVLIHFSLPTFLIVLSLGPVTWATNAFLVNQPNGYAEMGVFNAAFQWQAALQLLTGVICTAMVPVMSEKCGEGNMLISLRVMNSMLKGVLIITIPFALALCAVSPLIMRGYGVSFASGYWVMIMLVATGAMTAILTPVANYIMASGMMWTGFFINTGWVIAMLIGAWFFVRWGAEGLAGSRLLASLIHVGIVLSVFPRIAAKSFRKTLFCTES